MIRARVPALLIRVALSAVAWVLAHNLLFLVTYGASAGVVLARTGHGPQWGQSVAAVGVIGLALLAGAAVRVMGLRTEVKRGAGAARPVGPPSPGAIAAAAGRLWLVCAPLAASALIVQENLEHAAVGLPLPWLGVLYSAEYPYTVPVVALVGLAVAVVAALFAVRLATLEALLAASRDRARHRPPPPARRLRSAHAPRTSLLGRRLAGRAPPRPADPAAA